MGPSPSPLQPKKKKRCYEEEDDSGAKKAAGRKCDGGSIGDDDNNVDDRDEGSSDDLRVDANDWEEEISKKFSSSVSFEDCCGEPLALPPLDPEEAAFVRSLPPPPPRPPPTWRSSRRGRRMTATARG